MCVRFQLATISIAAAVGVERGRCELQCECISPAKKWCQNGARDNYSRPEIVPDTISSAGIVPDTFSGHLQRTPFIADFSLTSSRSRLMPLRQDTLVPADLVPAVAPAPLHAKPVLWQALQARRRGIACAQPADGSATNLAAPTEPSPQREQGPAPPTDAAESRWVRVSPGRQMLRWAIMRWMPDNPAFAEVLTVARKLS